jgi:hypothetical protein
MAFTISKSTSRTSLRYAKVSCIDSTRRWSMTVSSGSRNHSEKMSPISITIRLSLGR